MIEITTARNVSLGVFFVAAHDDIMMYLNWIFLLIKFIDHFAKHMYGMCFCNIVLIIMGVSMYMYFDKGSCILVNIHINLVMHNCHKTEQEVKKKKM